MQRKAQSLNLPLEEGIICGLKWPGEGRPIVALHGLFDSATGWVEIAYGTDRPFYALSLPGFAGSDDIKGTSIVDYAKQISAAVDFLDIKDATLLGHSFGGAVASELAAEEERRARESDEGEGPSKERGRISDVVLIAPVGYGYVPLAHFFDLPGVSAITALLTARATAIPPLSGFAYSHFVAGGHRPEGDLLRRLQLLGPDIKDSLSHAIHAMALSGNDLKKYFWSGPALCLWGQHDRLIPKRHIRRLQSLLPQTRLVIWPDAAHHPQAEFPERFIDLLKGWSEETERRGR